MNFASNKIDSGTHCQEGIDDEVEESFGSDGQMMNGPGPPNLASDATNASKAPFATCCTGHEVHLPYKHLGSTGSSAPLRSGAESRMVPNRAPASRFTSNDETQAEFNADLGGDGGASDGRPLGGVGDGTGNEYRLAEEDWLDAAQALFDTVGDPSTES